MRGEDKKPAKSPVHLCSFTAFHVCHLLPAKWNHKPATYVLSYWGLLFITTLSPPLIAARPLVSLPFLLLSDGTDNQQEHIHFGLLTISGSYFCSGIYLTVSSGDRLPGFVGGWAFLFTTEPFQHDPDIKFRLYSLKINFPTCGIVIHLLEKQVCFHQMALQKNN